MTRPRTRVLATRSPRLFSPSQRHPIGVAPGNGRFVLPLTNGKDAILGTGVLSFGAGATVDLSIDGTVAGSQYTQLSVVGDVNLTGTNLYLGGGGFMTIQFADGRKTFLDFREKAPLAATRDMYLDSAGNVIKGASTKGHLAVGVPGSVAGLEYARAKYGTRPRSALIAPAIGYAERGFVLDQGDIEKIQVHEKSAHIATGTAAFDDDLALLRAALEAQQATIFNERSGGIAPERRITVEIGVHPDKFDAIVEKLRQIGHLESISVQQRKLGGWSAGRLGSKTRRRVGEERTPFAALTPSVPPPLSKVNVLPMSPNTCYP